MEIRSCVDCDLAKIGILAEFGGAVALELRFMGLAQSEAAQVLAQANPYQLSVGELSTFIHHYCCAVHTVELTCDHQDSPLSIPLRPNKLSRTLISDPAL